MKNDLDVFQIWHREVKSGRYNPKTKKPEPKPEPIVKPIKIPIFQPPELAPAPVEPKPPILEPVAEDPVEPTIWWQIAVSVLLAIVAALCWKLYFKDTGGVPSLKTNSQDLRTEV